MTEPRDRPGDLTDDNIEAVSDSFPSYQQCAVCKADRILDLGAQRGKVGMGLCWWCWCLCWCWCWLRVGNVQNGAQGRGVSSGVDRHENLGCTVNGSPMVDLR
jgi:hypothetical protein